MFFAPFKSASPVQAQAGLASRSPEALTTFQKLIRGDTGIEGVTDDLDDQEVAMIGIKQFETKLANQQTRAQLANVLPNFLKTIYITGNTKIRADFVAGGSKSVRIG